MSPFVDVSLEMVTDLVRACVRVFMVRFVSVNAVWWCHLPIHFHHEKTSEIHGSSHEQVQEINIAIFWLRQMSFSDASWQVISICYHYSVLSCPQLSEPLVIKTEQ